MSMKSLFFCFAKRASPACIIFSLLLVLLAGCSSPAATPAAPPAAQLQPVTPATQPPPPPAPIRTPAPGEPEPLFTYIGTTAVTPNELFDTGAFVRIHYVPATGSIMVTSDGELTHPVGECDELGHGYVEYDLDMQPIGNMGVYNCGGGDIGTLMVENTLYDVKLGGEEGHQIGWIITSYNAETWRLVNETYLPLDDPRYAGGDEMVSYVNGQIDISSQYMPASGHPPTIDEGGETYHEFFTTELEFLEEKILGDTPHINGSSLLYQGGMYYFVAADTYDGDVIVMQYDSDWNYLGSKTLVEQAHWSTGLVSDGTNFYLAYLDTSQRSDPGFLPVHLNVHLAAFDQDWNLLEDVAVTDYAPEDDRLPGRPYLLMHDDRLYVSYDCDTIDSVTQEENLQWQAFVSVYALGETSGQVQPPVGEVDGCLEADLSPLGVMRSTDNGATWQTIGNACMPGTEAKPVDPTALLIDGQIVLYFIDFDHLNQDFPQSIYRATSNDGIYFTTAVAAYIQDVTMVDPAVVHLADGTYRMYVPSTDEGNIIATSPDGLSFTRLPGAELGDGGMPGALLLPDGRVRVFLNSALNGQAGIISRISSDGENFTLEDGLRITAPQGMAINNAQPLRLLDGTYLMMYQLFPPEMMDQPDPWTFTEIHLATSPDGFTWTPGDTIIGYGGTSAIVQMPDGALYIFYGYHE